MPRKEMLQMMPVAMASSSRMRRAPGETRTRLQQKSILSNSNVSWGCVEDRLNGYPEEAAERHEGRSLLAAYLARRADESYPTAQVVKAFLKAYPPAIWERENGPLEAACWRLAPLSILVELTEARPSMPHDARALGALWDSYTALFRRWNMSIIDHICEGGREGAEIWQKLHLILNYCTEPNSSLMRWRCLHAAATSPRCSVDLFTMIVNVNPGEVRRRDEKGRLPLHLLATVPHVSWREKLNLLIHAYPGALRTRDDDGFLPIHVAVITGQSIEFVNVLVRAAPDTLHLKGGSDNLYPFLWAAVSTDPSLSTGMELLRSAPHLIQANHEASPTEESEKLPTGSICDDEDLTEATPSNGNLLDLVSSRKESKLWNELSELLRMGRGPSTTIWKVVHAASSLSNLSPLFMELAIRLHPEEARQRDKEGRLPLHIVSTLEFNEIPIPFHGDEDVRSARIKTVLQAFPPAVRVPDNNGNLALHGAATSGQTWASLRELIRAAPDTLTRRDGSMKLYPFQLAACSPLSHLNEVYQLLKAAPHLVVKDAVE